MKYRVLILTLVAGAVITSISPALSQVALYDRRAVLDGELWRLFTAPLVHFTPTHLAYDAVALMLAGTLIQWRGHRGFGWVCGLTPLATGLAVLSLEPQLAFYGGLSGVATAGVVLLALQGLREPGDWRWVCATALLAAAGKILFEASTDRFAFISMDAEAFRPVPLCHIAGMLVGAAVFAFQQFVGEAARPCVRSCHQ